MPDLTHPSARWLARVTTAGPRYLGILAAIEGAIRDGELQPADQLPPQRTVAELLGVDLTTVTRAYSAARARGLIEGAVGRGTFVRAGASEDEAGRVDLGMNLPPAPHGVSLGAMLKETTAAILDRTDPATLMAYHPAGGSLGQKAAAASWLAPVYEAAPERVLIASGAQTGLAAVFAAIAGAGGDSVVVAPLVFPGALAAARQFGLRLLVCREDEAGLDPDALNRLCAENGPSALYVTPTTNNPTAVTLDPDRRGRIAAIARAEGLWIVEDDPYARLFDRPHPALASFAPERTFHLATLSKTLSPGLRTAFLVPPPGEMAERAAAALQALSLMPSPLMTAVVSAWIREGVAERLLSGVRREARARRALAAEILPQARGAAESIHVWLDLPSGASPDRIDRLAQERGLALATASAFASGPDHPNGLRISLGGPAKQAVLRGALEAVAAILSDSSRPRIVV